MNKIFQFFKLPLFHNGRPYGYARWRVLRDLYELSQKISLRNFDANIAKLTTF